MTQSARLGSQHHPLMCLTTSQRGQQRAAERSGVGRMRKRMGSQQPQNRATATVVLQTDQVPCTLRIVCKHRPPHNSDPQAALTALMFLFDALYMSCTSRSITVRKSKYDLGKKFFTNITPGYQLYPAVFLMPWTDPNAPNDYFLFMYTCRTGQIVRFTSDGNFLPMWDMCVTPADRACSCTAVGWWGVHCSGCRKPWLYNHLSRADSHGCCG